MAPELEAAWVKRARRVTIKRLRDEVRRARLVGTGAVGEAPECDVESLPTSAFEPGVARRRALRPVEVLPATDAEWQASLRRYPGMTRERVLRLGRMALEAPAADVLRRFRLPEDLGTALAAAVESERQRLSKLAETLSEPRSDSPPTLLAAHEYAKRLRRLPAWVGLLALLEDFARTHDDPRAIPKREWKATYERDNYRCTAPGCTRRCRIHDHHIDYRSDLGSDELWNQISVCDFHHLQGEHGELARIRGRAPLKLTWRVGRSDLASYWRNERRLDPPTCTVGAGSQRESRTELANAMAFG